MVSEEIFQNAYYNVVEAGVVLFCKVFYFSGKFVLYIQRFVACLNFFLCGLGCKSHLHHLMLNVSINILIYIKI